MTFRLEVCRDTRKTMALTEIWLSLLWWCTVTGGHTSQSGCSCLHILPGLLLTFLPLLVCLPSLKSNVECLGHCQSNGLSLGLLGAEKGVTFKLLVLVIPADVAEHFVKVRVHSAIGHPA